MWYRGVEREGWDRFDDAEDVFGPYEDEGYSKKPVRSDRQAGVTHHLECGFDIEPCLCFELYNRDYEEDKEKELEEMHAEYWQ